MGHKTQQPAAPGQETEVPVPPTTLPEVTNAVEFPVKITLRGKPYTVDMLSGYRYMRIYGDGSRLTRDVYTELIAAAVTEPVMEEEFIREKLPYDVFIALAEFIFDAHQASLKNLRGSVPKL